MAVETGKGYISSILVAWHILVVYMIYSYYAVCIYTVLVMVIESYSVINVV